MTPYQTPAAWRESPYFDDAERAALALTEAWQAATADPEFQQRISAVIADPGVPCPANPAMYQVADDPPPACGPRREQAAP